MSTAERTRNMNEQRSRQSNTLYLAPQDSVHNYNNKNSFLCCCILCSRQWKTKDIWEIDRAQTETGTGLHNSLFHTDNRQCLLFLKNLFYLLAGRRVVSETKDKISWGCSFPTVPCTRTRHVNGIAVNVHVNSKGEIFSRLARFIMTDWLTLKKCARK